MATMPPVVSFSATATVAVVPSEVSVMTSSSLLRPILASVKRMDSTSTVDPVFAEMTTLPVVLEMVRLPAGVPAASVCVIVAAVLSSVTDSFISVVPVSVVAPATPSVVPTVNDPDAVNRPVTVADAKVASPVVSSVPATVTAPAPSVMRSMSLARPILSPVKRMASTSTYPLLLTIVKPPAAFSCVILAAIADSSISESTVTLASARVSKSALFAVPIVSPAMCTSSIVTSLVDPAASVMSPPLDMARVVVPECVMAWVAAFIVTVPDAVRAATVVVCVNVVPPEATVAMVAPPTSRMWPWSDLIVSLVVSPASCSILSLSSLTVPAALIIGSVVAMNRSAAIDPRGKPIGPRRPFAMSRSHQRGFF
mmetsp:Transcript_7818/g.35519  ORF Transcript_7818/g.35519 Transcript_7818/m.35519 type:complete len:368 (-) Transcript_7818:231-1334(-)